MFFMDKIKEFVDNAAKTGLKLPFAYDPVEKAPSITLWFLHLTFTVALFGSVALYFKPNLLQACCFSLAFWVIAMVFYRMRKLDKVKLDLNNKSIEIDGESKD
jgi:hypothetical protein